jgi:MGT family glycosyltransferase
LQAAGGGDATVSGKRFLVAAFGDPGHAFPAIALARALAGRGNEVLVETWERWREAVEDAGLAFTAAEEYKTFPPPPPGADEGASAADAALALLPMLEAERFDVVVSDILTVAPALAAERAGLRRATLIPHVYPVHEEGLPFFAVGALPARTPVGRALWRGALPVLVGGLKQGREEFNESRAAVGLAPTERLHGGISEQLALVATFPQLEYPRRWPPYVQVTGPMQFELTYPDVELPPGDEPLVLVAPSTAQDPECRLVRAALEALADEPVRVLATTNRHLPAEPLPPAPANAVVVDWLSYTQAMAAADLVICHGGHGTVARALGAGAPVICCPAVGDMAENGARVAWAGAGLMLPWRLMGAASLRVAVRQALGDPGLARRAAEIAAWAATHDGAERGAKLVERLAAN